jgi:hypothetical protein
MVEALFLAAAEELSRRKRDRARVPDVCRKEKVTT